MSDGARRETPRRFRLTFSRRSGLTPSGSAYWIMYCALRSPAICCSAFGTRDGRRDLYAAAAGLLRAIAEHLLAIALIRQGADGRAALVGRDRHDVHPGTTLPELIEHFVRQTHRPPDRLIPRRRRRPDAPDDPLDGLADVEDALG